MTLTEWLTAEIITAENALERYGDDPDSRSYWIGALHALNNTLDYLEGAEVYIESENR